MVSFRINSGVLAATSSISMPPAEDAMNTGLPCTRSSTMPRYNSRSMGSVSSISSRCTTRPSGPVWCVISVMPRILSAIFCGFLGVHGDLDSAAFAAASGVNLRLDHHAAADRLGCRLGFRGRSSHFAAGHRYIEIGQDGLGLVFVYFHGNVRVPTCASMSEKFEVPTITCRSSPSCTRSPTAGISIRPTPRPPWG